jgi:L-lactate dehydrogenase (cytochrome)
MTFDAEDPHEIGKSGGDEVDRSRGAAKAITVSSIFHRRVRADHHRTQGFIDPGLKWADISWFKSITKSSPHLSDLVMSI